jgi:hypothetical protein
MVNVNVPGYDPGKRKRCVNVAWSSGRRVRILHPAFGYGGKTATITGVGERFVYVTIKTGRKPDQWEAVAYVPGDLHLIAR